MCDKLWFHCLIIIALGLIAYGSILPARFKTLDDRFSIIENPAIKSPARIPEIFRQGFFRDQFYYRPLVNLSFMGEYRAFGLNSFYYNLDNLILHILNALLVFLLASRLTNNAAIGFWAGLLFVIHPLQWEAVCNISGRAILLSAFFTLSAFVCFLLFHERRQWHFLLMALAAFFLGLLSKESAAVLPAVILMYVWINTTRAWRGHIREALPFIAVLAGYIFLRYHLGITRVFGTDHFQIWLLGFVTFLRSVITHARLFVLPVDLHFDRCLPFFASFTQLQAMGTIVFWTAALSALYVRRAKIAPFVLFLILWFALELLPVSQLLTSIGVGAGWVSTADHFLYAASVPVFIGMVLAFRWFYALNQTRVFLAPVVLKFCAGGFLAFLLVTAMEQSIYASDEFSMLQRSVQFQPNNPRVQASMALQYVFREDFAGAQRHFQAALDVEPLNPRYRISLGTALCQQRQWVECLGQYIVLDDPAGYDAMLERQKKMAMAHIMQDMRQGKILDARGWLILGIYYAKGGQMQEAIDAFEKTVSLNPAHADAWLNLGSLYEAKQDWPQARWAFQHLLSIEHLTVFQRGFGQTHLTRVQGR